MGDFHPLYRGSQWGLPLTVRWPKNSAINKRQKRSFFTANRQNAYKDQR